MGSVVCPSLSRPASRGLYLFTPSHSAGDKKRGTKRKRRKFPDLVPSTALCFGEGFFSGLFKTAWWDLPTILQRHYNGGRELVRPDLEMRGRHANVELLQAAFHDSQVLSHSITNHGHCLHTSVLLVSWRGSMPMGYTLGTARIRWLPLIVGLRYRALIPILYPMTHLHRSLPGITLAPLRHSSAVT